VLVTVPKGIAASMKPVLERKDPLVAPLAQNSKVGTLKMMVDGKPVRNCRWWRWKKCRRRRSSAGRGIRCACVVVEVKQVTGRSKWVGLTFRSSYKKESDAA
jgi:hypothetical protein